MQIKLVRYTKLVSDGNYNNESYGGEMVVGDGESPDECMEVLKAWVQQKIDVEASAEQEALELQTQVSNLEWRKHNLERDIQEAVKKFDWLKDVLEKHGVKLESEIPF